MFPIEGAQSDPILIQAHTSETTLSPIAAHCREFYFSASHDVPNIQSHFFLSCATVGEMKCWAIFYKLPNN